MPAYVISEVEVRDAAGFETYRTMAAPTIAQYGGRYLVRGGMANAAEGGPPPNTLIECQKRCESLAASSSPPSRTPCPRNMRRR